MWGKASRLASRFGGGLKQGFSGGASTRYSEMLGGSGWAAGRAVGGAGKAAAAWSQTGGGMSTLGGAAAGGLYGAASDNTSVLGGMAMGAGAGAGGFYGQRALRRGWNSNQSAAANLGGAMGMSLGYAKKQFGALKGGATLAANQGKAAFRARR